MTQSDHADVSDAELSGTKTTCSTHRSYEFSIKTQNEGLKYLMSPHFTASYLTRDAAKIIHQGCFSILPSELQIKDKIGEGQFGAVFKGNYDGQACAIKKLKDGITSGVQYERLLLEISILSGVGNHPNLVCFLGACLQDDGAPMIVEELVAGPDLAEYLKNKKYEFNLGQPTVILLSFCSKGF